jgi:hypothetical protein
MLATVGMQSPYADKIHGAVPGQEGVAPVKRMIGEVRQHTALSFRDDAVQPSRFNPPVYFAVACSPPLSAPENRKLLHPSAWRCKA